MGPISARAALESLDVVSDVLGIELMCAAQAIDLRPPAPLGSGSQKVYDAVRRQVTQWGDDRVLHPDLAAMGASVRRGVFSKILESGS